MNCEHGHHSAYHHEMSYFDFLPSEFGLLLALFLTGLVGSFTHCISMCGPIAIAQMSVKLSKKSKDKISQKSRLEASLLLPYYFGKAVTYAFLCMYLNLVVQVSGLFVSMKYVGIAILFLTALLFFKAAFSNSFSFGKYIDLFSHKSVVNFFAKKTKKLYLHPYGLKGFILGMILGLIPCGLVYATIVTAISGSHNEYWAGLGIFVFGMGTIPGLFISAYLGSSLAYHERFKKYFRVIFSITMIINAILILRYALKLV